MCDTPQGTPGPPSRLPPLLPVPEPPSKRPAPTRPKPPPGAAVEYDRSLLYLPDPAPPAPVVAHPPPSPERLIRLAPAVLIGWTGPVGAGHGGGRAGLAADAGVWLDPDRTRGIDGGVLYLSPGVTRATALFQEPDGAAVRTRYVTADAAYRRRLAARTGARIDALFGYRFDDLAEDLSADAGRPGLTTRTRFHGGEVGLAAAWEWEHWAVGLTGKVALGGAFAHADGLAGDEARFAVAPTAAVNAGHWLNDRARVFAGYQLRYLSRAVRPEPGTGNEPPRAGWADFWAQGVSIGMEWRY